MLAGESMDDETREWLAEGIAHAKAGRREQARDLLLRVVERDERNAPAWLWLSGVVDDPHDRRVALENVLDLDPDNAPARKGLEWLARQTPASEPEPASFLPEHPYHDPNSLPPAPQEASFDPTGCPYCGHPVAESDAQCPHCARALIVRAPKTEFATRAGLLAGLCIVMAIVSLADIVLIGLALRTLGRAELTIGAGYFATYLAGAAFKSLRPTLFAATLFFVGFDLVSAAWALVVAAILPGRRPAAPAIAFFVVAMHGVLAVGSLIVGMSSPFFAAPRTGLVVLIGMWLLEAHGDFEWETIHHRLELDDSAQSSMDYYTQGRYYRKLEQTAKAILHLERAIELNADKFEYRVALGNAYYAMGRHARAAEQLRAALQLNPQAADVRALLDIVTQRMSESRTGMV
jgi:tetratricopeptide (TPR) repeat protein